MSINKSGLHRKLRGGFVSTRRRLLVLIAGRPSFDYPPYFLFCYLQRHENSRSFPFNDFTGSSHGGVFLQREGFTGRQQRGVHSHSTTVPAEGLRQVSHRIQLRTFEDRGGHRISRETAF